MIKQILRQILLTTPEYKPMITVPVGFTDIEPPKTKPRIHDISRLRTSITFYTSSEDDDVAAFLVSTYRLKLPQSVLHPSPISQYNAYKLTWLTSTQDWQGEIQIGKLTFRVFWSRRKSPRTLWSWIIRKPREILSQICSRTIFETHTAPGACLVYAHGSVFKLIHV